MPDMNSAKAPQPGGYPPAAFFSGIDTAVLVPDVIGMAEADAIAAITAAGFVPENTIYPKLTSNNSLWGLVAETDPIAGAEALPGSTVLYSIGAELQQN